MTTVCPKPGTGSQELQADKCPLELFPETIVVRMLLDGSVVDILQWPKGLSHAGYASIGPVPAVSGLGLSEFKIVAPSSCTSCSLHPPAGCVTAATISGHQVGFNMIFLAINRKY